MKQQEEEFLECEKEWVFMLLIFIGGFFGAFTYSIRGGVFCNAQTGNFVLSAMALGNGDWRRFIYYFIPMTAYFMGAFVSESAPDFVRERWHIRWDTFFIALEMVAVVFLALLPETAPFQITQVMVNFIASMQYNTFRQAQGTPMATTFCTNHIRQVGVAASKYLRFRKPESMKRMLFHCRMLFCFVVGGVVATVLCRFWLGKAMFFALVPLGILLVDLLRADLTSDPDTLARNPRGH